MVLSFNSLPITKFATTRFICYTELKTSLEASQDPVIMQRGIKKIQFHTVKL